MTKKVGRKADSSRRKLLVGHRMKLAAEQAGYPTTVAMGEAMGLPNSTISRWWNGLQTPNLEEMARYAEIVGKRSWWFYIDGNDAEFDLVAECLMDIVGYLMQGRDLADSYSQVVGEPNLFGVREQREIAPKSEVLREHIISETGPDWEGQPLRRRRKVIDRLSAKVLRSPEE